MSERVPLAKVRDLLQIGHPLPFRVLDSHERLLLNRGQSLLNEAQFDSLVERGAWAERTLVEAERATRAGDASKTKALAPSLFDRWERLLWELDKLTRALARRQTEARLVVDFCASLRALIDKDRDVALFMSVRNDDKRFALYPLTHSLHCAVLSILTARHLGWPEERITTLGCSALTMNLAILELQAVMAEQDEPPTPIQLRDIRAHPAAAVKLLRETGVDDEEWLTTVAEHHEHRGGGGYPTGAATVSDAAHVLHASDVFMAKISPRAKRPPIAPQAAVRELFQQNPGDPLAMAVIKTLGIHPPGSLVQLSSGEVGVSIRLPAAGTHPIVATLGDRNGRPSSQTHVRDTSQAEFKVQGVPQDTKPYARVLPERVYGLLSA
jgi:HD-GYP domain-containing protein (c-di-GMP phosphodiesterase class II)